MPELSGGFAAEQPVINAQPPHTLDTAVAQCWVRNKTCSMTNRQHYFKRNYLLQKVKNSTRFESCSNRYFKILSTILPVSEVTNTKFRYDIFMLCFKVLKRTTHLLQNCMEMDKQCSVSFQHLNLCSYSVLGLPVYQLKFISSWTNGKALRWERKMRACFSNQYKYISLSQLLVRILGSWSTPRVQCNYTKSAKLYHFIPPDLV